MAYIKGANKNESYPHDALAVGTVLNGYKIKSVLGRGAFGITYLAMEEKLDWLVAIKEYLPKEFAVRDESSTVHPREGSCDEMFQYGRESFLREAQTLVKFKHPNIVRVLTFFEQYETAYLVMEYEEGIDLSEYLQRSKEPLSQSDLLAIFIPINQGLATVHGFGFIHRDIKPANIYIRKDKSPVLLDFGAARDVIQHSAAELTRILTEGYAPYEQDNPAWFKQGPWTDIYALGATLYFAVMGKKPISASERAAAFMMKEDDPYVSAQIAQDKGYTKAFLDAIDRALAFHPQDRPQSLGQWSQMLIQQDGAQQDIDATVLMPSEELTDAPATAIKQGEETDERIPIQEKLHIYKKFILRVIIIVGMAIIICTGIVYVYYHDSIHNDEVHDDQNSISMELLDSLVSQAMVYAKLAISQYTTAQVTAGHIEQYKSLPSTSDRTKYISGLEMKLKKSKQDFERNLKEYANIVADLGRYPSSDIKDGVSRFLQHPDYRENWVYQQLGTLLMQHSTNESIDSEKLKNDLISLSVKSGY